MEKIDWKKIFEDGSIKKVSEWEIAILKSIDKSGGEAKCKKIYFEISHFIKLTDKDLRVSGKYGNRPDYHHTIRGYLNILKKKGYVESPSWDCWIITDEGREIIKSN